MSAEHFREWIFLFPTNFASLTSCQCLDGSNQAHVVWLLRWRNDVASLPAQPPKAQILSNFSHPSMEVPKIRSCHHTTFPKAYPSSSEAGMPRQCSTRCHGKEQWTMTGWVFFFLFSESSFYLFPHPKQRPEDSSELRYSVIYVMAWQKQAESQPDIYSALAEMA